MAYSDFTIPQIKERFGIKFIEDEPLFTKIYEYEPPEYLINSLKRYLPLALNINTEKARSELLMAPLLVEFKLLHNESVSLFSGTEFNVDDKQGLKGHCDYIICNNPEQLVITAPVCIIVEAKNDNITGGIPQCIAEMIAAMIFNQQQHVNIMKIYGIITTGVSWRFVSLENSIATIDITEYSIQMPHIIFGLLDNIIQTKF